jgi:protein-arginine kinase activator protein McsA
MKIYCHICHRYMGEIRDGTIRKGTKYVCAECAKPKQDDFDFIKELQKIAGVK